MSRSPTSRPSQRRQLRAPSRSRRSWPAPAPGQSRRARCPMAGRVRRPCPGRGTPRSRAPPARGASSRSPARAAGLLDSVARCMAAGCSSPERSIAITSASGGLPADRSAGGVGAVIIAHGRSKTLHPRGDMSAAAIRAPAASQGRGMFGSQLPWRPFASPAWGPASRVYQERAVRENA